MLRTGKQKKIPVKKDLLTDLFISCCTKRRKTSTFSELYVKILYYEYKHKNTDCTVLIFSLLLQHRFSVKNLLSEHEMDKLKLTLSFESYHTSDLHVDLATWAQNIPQHQGPYGKAVGLTP